MTIEDDRLERFTDDGKSWTLLSAEETERLVRQAAAKEKKALRETKRAVKKDGNRSRRRHLQRQIQTDPDNAHLSEDYDYKHNSSTRLNGMDNDATRKKD